MSKSLKTKKLPGSGAPLFLSAPATLLNSDGIKAGFTPPSSMPGDLAWIPINLLLAGGAIYQRESFQGHVNKIAKQWKWENVVPITVCLRDDDCYNIIDGQHRVIAAMLRGDISHMPCYVIPDDGLTVEKEAQTFVDVNEIRRGLTGVHRHRAKVMAKDDEAMAIEEILERHGLCIENGKGASSISTVNALYTCYRRHGPIIFDQVIRLITARWSNDDRHSKSAVFVNAVTRLYSNIERMKKNPDASWNITYQEIIDRFSEIDFSEIKLAASKQELQHPSVHKSVIWLYAMVYAFDKGKRAKKLLPHFKLFDDE